VSIDDLYQEIILDHYRRPRHHGPCPGCSAQVKHHNPLCGDEITVGVGLEGETVAQIAFDGHGCSISQASASMMTESVQGMAARQALELVETVRRMMHGERPAEDLGDLMALGGVAKFPVRVKCALLPWMALRAALAHLGHGLERGGSDGSSSRGGDGSSS